MTWEEIIKGLDKIGDFFRARADMAVGDAKMLLLNWVRCAQEAAEMIAAQKAEGERETTSSVSAGGAATFPRGEGFWGGSAIPNPYSLIPNP